MSFSDTDQPQEKQSTNVWKWIGIGCGGCFTHGQQPEQLAQTVYNSLDCK